MWQQNGGFDQHIASISIIHQCFKLTRGFNNDYVIDYNLGEITFTNKVLITQFSRIRVDFEFADQNYSRSIVQASHYQSNDKLNFSLNFYRERDNRNQPLAIDLTDEEFEYIFSYFETVKKRKHQYLIQEGEIAQKEYLKLNYYEYKQFIPKKNYSLTLSYLH